MNRIALLFSFAAISIGSVLLAGCGGGAEEGAAAGGGGGGGGGATPGAAVSAMYDAMNAAKYSDVEKFMGPVMADMMKNTGGAKIFSDDMTNNGSMTKLEILSEEERGEGGTVKVRVHFKDGSVEDEEFSTIKIDGKWRVTL